MRFIVDRDILLKPLQTVQGAVERRHSLPILSNVLLECTDGTLAVTATDLEAELMAKVPLGDAAPGETTVPARKIVDICRALPNGAKVEFELDGDRVSIRSGRSRFTLSTLPAADYPTTEAPPDSMTVDMKRPDLKRLLDLTHFAMAQQDVRYYLNGLLLEIAPDVLRAVATDGHRLALAELKMSTPVEDEPRQIIVPRKGVMELLKLLGDDDEAVKLMVGSNAIQVEAGDVRLNSKLIDGKFPDYGRVIPDVERCDKRALVDRDKLRQSLVRASILSNEKHRAIRLAFDEGILRLVASNPEQEQAEDEVDIDYTGEPVEVGFNVSYLIEALGVLPTNTAQLFLTDADSSCLILPEGRDDCRYVVMPMRL